MKILFIGGTRFVGRAMVAEAVGRGHEVSVFHRGQTSLGDIAGVRELIGDRVRDFTALQTGSLDVVVDVCGYRPHEIHAMADVVAGRHRKYVFVSTISVHADDIAHGGNELSALVDVAVLDEIDPITCPIDGTTYGALKVLCEAAVREHYKDYLIIRPTYVIGPDDYTQRFPTWVKRCVAGGEVLAPEPAQAAFQYIDARDLATFTIDAIENNLIGEFLVAAPQPPFSFGQMLETVAEAIGAQSLEFSWISAEAAIANETDFPLWAGGEDSGVMAFDTSKAMAAGLKPRPLAESVRDVLTWINQT